MFTFVLLLLTVNWVLRCCDFNCLSLQWLYERFRLLLIWALSGTKFWINFDFLWLEVSDFNWNFLEALIPQLNYRDLKNEFVIFRKSFRLISVSVTSRRELQLNLAFAKVNATTYALLSLQHLLTNYSALLQNNLNSEGVRERLLSATCTIDTLSDTETAYWQLLKTVGFVADFNVYTSLGILSFSIFSPSSRALITRAHMNESSRALLWNRSLQTQTSRVLHSDWELRRESLVKCFINRLEMFWNIRSLLDSRKKNLRNF